MKHLNQDFPLKGSPISRSEGVGSREDDS